MNGKQLKNSILQWAIQGKLVPQNPKDEPASKLLERIAAQRNIASGAKQSKKNPASRIYREGSSWFEQVGSAEPKDITEEIPFDIPESWEWCRLKDVVWHLSDGSHKTPKYTENGIPFVSVKNMSSGKLSFDNTKFISKEESDELNKRCNPEKGDILLSKVGTTGVPAIVDCERQFSLFVSLALIKFYPNYLDTQFFISLINSPLVQDQVKEHTRGVGNKNWVLSDIANTLLAIPPLAEQKRIVKKLEQILPLVDEYDQAQTQLDKLNKELPEALKKSILQQAIQGKLIPQNPKDEPADKLLERITISRHSEHSEESSKKSRKSSSKNPVSRIYRDTDGLWYEQIGSSEPVNISEEIPFEIPETWTWCRIGLVINLLSGRDLEPSQYNSSQKGVPYMTGASNFTKNALIVNRWTECPITVSHKGDLLITCKGTIGTMVFNDVGDVHIARQIMAISSNWVNLEYVKYFLASYVNELQKSARSMIPGISRDDMLSSFIPLPPLAEQKRIVAKLEELMGASGSGIK